MSLIAVSESIEIKKLWDSFKKSLQQNALRYQRNVGWHGGNIATDVYWLPDQGFWVAFNHDPKSNREWSAFGTMDPSNSKVLSITCEVNIPFQGVNRQIAGVFVRDTDSGKIFIAHSGKIGGGQKGIGKKLFWQRYKLSDPVNVQFPDLIGSEMALIGAISDDLFLKQLSTFIHEIEKIKSFQEDYSSGLTQTNTPRYCFTRYSPKRDF